MWKAQLAKKFDAHILHIDEALETYTRFTQNNKKYFLQQLTEEFLAMLVIDFLACDCNHE